MGPVWPGSRLARCRPRDQLGRAGHRIHTWQTTDSGSVATASVGIAAQGDNPEIRTFPALSMTNFTPSYFGFCMTSSCGLFVRDLRPWPAPRQGCAPARENGRMPPPLAPRTTTITPFRVVDVMEAAWAAERAGRSLVYLEVGEPDFGTPPPVVEAATKAIAD